MPSIELSGRDIEYDVRYSEEASRPRIDAGISDITVIIPHTSSLDPEELLREKSDWVLKKREEYESYLAKIPDRTFEEGEKITFLGQERQICLTDRERRITDNEVHLPRDRVDSSGVREEIESLFREKARQKIQELITQYHEEIGGDYDKLYIRDQKTKWASCSARDNLSFNWRLIMAPEEVIEYVVVHELVHLEEREHSEQFWRRVGEILPEYEQGMYWLKDNSHQLVFGKEDLT